MNISCVLACFPGTENNGRVGAARRRETLLRKGDVRPIPGRFAARGNFNGALHQEEGRRLGSSFPLHRITPGWSHFCTTTISSFVISAGQGREKNINAVSVLLDERTSRALDQVKGSMKFTF